MRELLETLSAELADVRMNLEPGHAGGRQSVLGSRQSGLCRRCGSVCCRAGMGPGQIPMKLLELRVFGAADEMDVRICRGTGRCALLSDCCH